MNGTTAAAATPEMLNAVFEGIYNEHHQMVYRAAYKVLRNPEDAADIKQRVFLRLIRSGLTPGRIANVKGYLYRTAFKEALALTRYRGVRKQEDADFEDLADPMTEMPGPEMRQAVMEALSQIKPEAVQMLSLQDEGYELAEIAQMLGKSLAVVGITMYRARLKLKKLIGQKTGRTK